VNVWAVMDKVIALVKLFGFLVLANIVLSGCHRSQDQTQSSDLTSTLPAHTIHDPSCITLAASTQTALNLGFGKAEFRPVDFSVKTTSEVLANANLTTHVTSPVAGRVTEVFATVGENVRNGETLLTIRSPDVEQAESDLLQNDAQVRADLKRDLLQIDSDIQQGGAQIHLSQSTFQRIKGLLEEKIASRADFEAAKTQYEKDKITIDTLTTKRQATVSLAEERRTVLTEPIKQKLRLLGVSDEQIARCLKTNQINPLVPVVSPATGLVTERLVNLGELVDPSKPLFTIADYHSVWLKADIYEKDVSKIQDGQTIKLELDSFPGEIFTGKLNYVADSINSDTRTLPVRAEVPNPGLKLKPKMFAKMTILVGEHMVLTVPKDAVQEAETNKVVYVPVAAHCFQEKRVELGSESDPYYEVLSGLRAGEIVVTRGSFDLRSESLKESE
jgi:membrane fusion protein, heavy metal efflux system